MVEGSYHYQLRKRQATGCKEFNQVDDDDDPTYTYYNNSKQQQNKTKQHERRKTRTTAQSDQLNSKLCERKVEGLFIWESALITACLTKS